MRKVYRYEDSLGVGPYNSTEWVDKDKQEDLLNEHNGLDTHPTWYNMYNILTALFGINAEFDPNEVTQDYLSGSESREALDAWFDGWTDTLESNGFQVVEYEVPDDHVKTGASGLQVAFLP